MSDRSTRFLARVDAHLPTLPSDAARRAFLADQINQWRERYLDFCRKVDAGKETPAGVTAFDYIETMAGIDQRIAREAA